MDCFSRIVAVGGLPEPIGGVTNFIYRLLASGRVSFVWDIYPSTKKIVPKNCERKVLYLKGKVHLFFGLFKYKKLNAVDAFFFNFSRAGSILFFLFMPKKNHEIFLLLHHGSLSIKRFKWVYRLAISRVDKIYCLSSRQLKFYKDLGVSEDKIITCKSYLPPKFDRSLCDKKKLHKIDEFFEGKKVIVCSGYPSAIYNHDWCIRFANENPDYFVAVFLYGEGEQYEDLQALIDESAKAKCFRDFNQFEFNYALLKATAYFRPTSEDSFGVAVADSVELGVPVLASNVCERYPGSYICSSADYSSFRDSALAFFEGRGQQVSGDRKKFLFSFQ